MKKWLIILIFCLVALAGLTWALLNLARYECTGCIEFKGVRRCPTAFGDSKEAALEEVIRTACATLASGVTEVVACGRLQASDVQCRATYDKSEPE